MLRNLRNNVFAKFLWGFMGLYLLNISVDTTDPNPDHLSENLSINDQESIVEIVVEKVLGFEDAIAEYDDTDTEDHNKRTNLKIDVVIPPNFEINNNVSHCETSTAGFPIIDSCLTMGFFELETPPPKI